MISGGTDGEEVRAPAFHECGLGPIPGLDVISGLSLLKRCSGREVFLRIHGHSGLTLVSTISIVSVPS